MRFRVGARSLRHLSECRFVRPVADGIALAQLDNVIAAAPAELAPNESIATRSSAASGCLSIMAT